MEVKGSIGKSSKENQELLLKKKWRIGDHWYIVAETLVELSYSYVVGGFVNNKIGYFTEEVSN